MVDELGHLRRIHDGAPAPDDSWVDDTRNELLAMADDEVAAAGHPEVEPERSRWERFLEDLVAAVRRPAVAIASVLLLVAGGWGVLRSVQQDPAEPPTAAQPTADEDPGTSTCSPGSSRELAASCTHPEGGYAVSYPEDWNTDSGETVPGCQVFDPEPVELEQDIGGGPFGAINIRPISVPVEVASDPGSSATVLSTDETTVDGRPALRQVIEHTGETAVSEGVRAYRYLVELEDGALLAIAYDIGEPPFDRKREILDEMMRTIEFERGD